MTELPGLRKGDCMNIAPPRGIAVVDVGATNSKVVLFSPSCEVVAERKMASVHVEGPPYRHIDPEPLLEFLRQSLPELNEILPIDVVVPCAHGAALACLANNGRLALPVMDYTAEPPPDIIEQYRKIMPGFDEVCCPLLPMALTHALQLYWQSQAQPQDFARIKTIIPWIQYIGYRLSGRAVTEITSMSCQTQLVDVVHGGPSSLVRRQGWTRLFPPMVKAWEVIGLINAEFGITAKVLAGIHDSSANYVRYLSGGIEKFTLLSTGTWIIIYNAAARIADLEADFDCASSTDIFGQPIATSRFFGGKEFEVLAGDAADATPSLAAVARLVTRGTMALPSFTGSAGPVPGSENKGLIIGQAPENAEEKSSLAALYCALMVAEQLDLVSSRGAIIVDGPFAQNEVFLGVLARLRAGQKLQASELRDGTAAGAACLALMRGTSLPSIALKLRDIIPYDVPGLAAYRETWRNT